MCSSDGLIGELSKLFHGWTFHGADCLILSRGIIIGFSSNLSLINYFFIASGLFTEVLSKELDWSFSVLNLYKPYDCKDNFWSSIFSLSYLSSRNLGIGGD
jgi:hypothetical protein